MAELNAEQKVAQQALQDAIEAHVAAYRSTPYDNADELDRGLLTDWIVVSCTEGYDEEGTGNNAYYLAFSNGSMADHRAMGLLEWAKHMLTKGHRTDDDG